MNKRDSSRLPSTLSDLSDASDQSDRSPQTPTFNIHRTPHIAVNFNVTGNLR